MKLMPFIASNVKARELKNERMKKDTEQLKIFMEIYQNAQLKMSNDCTITADEVLEKIITALPDINIIRREAEKRPQILDILKNIHNLSSVCADIELKNKVVHIRVLLNIQSYQTCQYLTILFVSIKNINKVKSIQASGNFSLDT
jgi:hypothetical protein